MQQQVAFEVRPPFQNATVVVGVAKGREFSGPAASLDHDGRLSRAMESSAFTGKEGQALHILGGEDGIERVLLLGMGKDGTEPSFLRRLGGRIYTELARSGASKAVVEMGLDSFQAAQLAFGYLLRSHESLRMGKPDEENPVTLTQLMVGTDDPDAANVLLQRMLPVAESVHLARDLTAMPAADLTPQVFAEKARDLARLGVDVEILDQDQLRAQGLNLLAAVGQGSNNPPCLVVLRWMAGEDEAPLVLVGKGITYDTGGIDIKHAGLEEMKSDMAGAAAVFGTVRALAQRKARVNVVGLLCLAENAVSGRAMRPGDVITAYGGRSVEIIDTDAEGRLVLADGVAYACDKFKPRAVVTIATLTGAVVVTLGRHHAGLMANDEDLAGKIGSASQSADEPVWRLPLDPALEEDLASDIADIKNCVWGLAPDGLHAAAFIKSFVPEGCAWAHLDIAGTARVADDGPLCPKGYSGFGVRLLERLAAEAYEV